MVTSVAKLYWPKPPSFITLLFPIKLHCSVIKWWFVIVGTLSRSSWARRVKNTNMWFYRSVGGHTGASVCVCSLFLSSLNFSLRTENVPSTVSNLTEQETRAKSNWSSSVRRCEQECFLKFKPRRSRGWVEFQAAGLKEMSHFIGD